MSQLSEHILDHIDIIDVVGRYVNLRKSGSNYTGLCPFHSEKTPSFLVSPSKQIFKCFGCGQGGNVIKFLMELEKMDYSDALKSLAEQGNLNREQLTEQYQKSSSSKKEKPDAHIGIEQNQLKILLKTVQILFQEDLTKNKQAQEYLHNHRKLSHEIIAHFGIGHAPDSFDQLISFLGAKGFTQEQMIQSGIAKLNQNNQIFSFFRGRITFPIYNQHDALIGFGARALKPGDEPKYLNSPETSIYEKSKILYGLNRAKHHIKEHQKLIIVEGYMDVIGLRRLGLPVGIATCGTALTPEHIKILKRYTQHIQLLFDTDNAGYQAAVRALKLCYEQEIRPEVLSLPEGNKDIDERANTQPSSEQIQTFTHEGQQGLQRLMDMLAKRYDLNSIVEKSKIMQEFFDVLEQVKSVALQDEMLQIFSKKIKSSYEITLSEFKKFLSNRKFRTSAKPLLTNNTQLNPNAISKELLLSSLLRQEYGESILPKDSKTSQLRSILKELSPTSEEQDTEFQRANLDIHQLRREKHLGELTDEQKYLFILKTLKDPLRILIQNTFKRTDLTDDQKTNLQKKLSEILK